jgi:hypothetical protein
LDSQISLVLIQDAGWTGGQHQWPDLIRSTFVNVLLPQ